MKKKTINSKAFDKACTKVGIELNAKSRSTPPKGIVIEDGMGNEYTISSDSRIVKVNRLEDKIVRTCSLRVAASQKRIRGRMQRTRDARRLQKTRPTESKG